MTIALVFTVVILVGVSATLWFMLCRASDEINNLEDFMLSLDEQTKGGVMTNDAYCALVNEASDIREARENDDE